MAAPAKKMAGIALLLGAPKKGPEGESDEAEPTKPSDAEYSEELAEALGEDSVSPERVAAMKRFVMSCMPGGKMKGMM